MVRSGTGGNVGKAGREGSYAPPIDQYRKRIARQDSRKEKSHLKQVKLMHDSKNDKKHRMFVTQLVTVLLAMLFLVAIVYGILYYSVGTN